MQRDARAWLWDVQQAALDIRDFVGSLGVGEYAATPLVHSAVERKFEIIGEALNQLARDRPDLAGRIPHVPQIVAFRNQLIHGYALVDHARVWNVVHHSLPELVAAVQTVLTDIDPAP